MNIAEIVDKNGDVVDYITEDSFNEAIEDPSNIDDTDVEKSMVDENGGVDNDGPDPVAVYDGELSLPVISKKGDPYCIKQDVNTNEAWIEDSEGNRINTKNKIDLPINLTDED